MQLIAITGIAGTEKGRLTLDMAWALIESGRQVAVLDNSGNNPISPPKDLQVRRNVRRINGTLNQRLHTIVAHLNADVVLLNVAESMPPDVLLGLLYQGDADVRVIALADDRTCDCFPELHAVLEAHADLTLHYPFSLEDALAVVSAGGEA